MIAVDIGAGAIKVWGPGGGVSFLSQVSSGKSTTYANTSGLGTGKRAMRIDFDGGAGFFCGPGAHDWGRPVENLTDERFTGSPELRALLYGALTAYHRAHGLPGKTGLIVGLTQSFFEGQGADDRVSRVRRWLTGEHLWIAGGVGGGYGSHSVEVDRVKLTSQTAGALFDYVLTEDGKFLADRRAKYRKEMAIISVGMNTLELLAVRNGIPIRRFQSSISAGVRRLLEIADPAGLHSRGELDEQLRAGALDVKDALPAWAAEVAGHIERVWAGAAGRFAAVVVVGGGAILLRASLLAQLGGRGYMAPDPVMAVARGLYKLGNKRR